MPGHGNARVPQQMAGHVERLTTEVAELNVVQDQPHQAIDGPGADDVSGPLEEITFRLQMVRLVSARGNRQNLTSVPFHEQLTDLLQEWHGCRDVVPAALA